MSILRCLFAVWLIQQCFGLNVLSPSQFHRRNSLGALSIGHALERFDTTRIRCPFFRRRATDFLEAAVDMGTFLASRHKSIDLSGFFPRYLSEHSRQVKSQKIVGLQSITTIAQEIAYSYQVRQCQVTGKLNSSLFDDACSFHGPDPDMPVKGLSKYISAASGLFSHSKSTCELVAIGTIKDSQVVVIWRIEGTVNLPWHPTIKPYFGATIYDRGCDGLIIKATEYWSVSALRAFLSTVIDLGAPNAPSAQALRSKVPDSVLSDIREVPSEHIGHVTWLELNPSSLLSTLAIRGAS